jgi:hypothetical protein
MGIDGGCSGSTAWAFESDKGQFDGLLTIARERIIDAKLVDER